MVGTVVLSDLKNQKIGFAKNVANGEFPARAICGGNQKDVFMSSRVDEENQISNFESTVVADGVCAFSPSELLILLKILNVSCTILNKLRKFVINNAKNADKNDKDVK